MNDFHHITVLLEETVALVTQSLSFAGDENNSQIWADCTLGGAGHTLRLLENFAEAFKKTPNPNATLELICCDHDSVALKVATERIRGWQANHPTLTDQLIVTPVALNFRDLPDWLKTHRNAQRLHGLIADLGVSSPQIDSPERGFSFLREGPLDMRMNTSQSTTAKDILLTFDAGELRQIFDDYGEEPRAGALAKAIVQDRAKGLLPLSNTVEFANYVSRVLGYHQSRVHPATRIFQALRIAVNEELAAVEELLSQLPLMMAPGSCAGLISFHSLEDRLVKRYFRAWEKGELNPEAQRKSEKKRWTESQMGLLGMTDDSLKPIGSEHPRGGQVASEPEIQANPRSRSARLRGFRFSES